MYRQIAEAVGTSYEEERGNTISRVLELLDRTLERYPTDSVWLRFGLENLDKGKEELNNDIPIRGEVSKDTAEWC